MKAQERGTYPELNRDFSDIVAVGSPSQCRGAVNKNREDREEDRSRVHVVIANV